MSQQHATGCRCHVCKPDPSPTLVTEAQVEAMIQMRVDRVRQLYAGEWRDRMQMRDFIAHKFEELEARVNALEHKLNPTGENHVTQNPPETT